MAAKALRSSLGVSVVSGAMLMAFGMNVGWGQELAPLRSAEIARETAAALNVHGSLFHFLEWSKPRMVAKDRAFLLSKVGDQKDFKLPRARARGDEVELNWSAAGGVTGKWEERQFVQLKLETGMIRVNQTDVRLPKDGEFPRFWKDLESALPKKRSSLSDLFIPEAHAISPFAPYVTPLLSTALASVVGLVGKFFWDQRRFERAIKQCESAVLDPRLQPGQSRSDQDKLSLAAQYGKLVELGSKPPEACSDQSRTFNSECTQYRKFQGCMAVYESRYNAVMPNRATAPVLRGEGGMDQIRSVSPAR